MVKSSNILCICAKFVWAGAAILVLLVTLYAFDGSPNSDAGVVLILSMLFLSFPSGLLYAALFTVVAILIKQYFSIIIPTSYFSIVLDWAALFALGYLQWFYLVPWLYRKWQASRAR